MSNLIGGVTWENVKFPRWPQFDVPLDGKVIVSREGVVTIDKKDVLGILKY